MKTPDTIYIIGAGAVGKALAVLLSMHGRQVMLVRASTDSSVVTSEDITLNTSAFLLRHRKEDQGVLCELSYITELVVITESHSNRSSRESEQKQGEFHLVVMQNGLNVEQPFLNLKNVYRCVLFSTSQVLEDGILSFKAVSPSPIGPVNAPVGDLDDIVNLLHTPEFAFRAEPDINRFAWEKTIINCAFNSICPLLEADNGIFYRNEMALGIATAIISEGVRLAAEYGVVIDEKLIVERLLLISQRSDGQLISTYDDLRHHRPTEIESLNLEVERLGIDIGKGELVKLTGIMGRMILVKSHTGRAGTL